MKNNTTKIILALSLALGAVSCAKVVSEGTNVAEKRYFDAYMATHYPDFGKIGKGIYIIDDQPSNGVEIKDSNYVFTRYICKDLSDNSIVSYTDAVIAQKLGEYDKSYDFSPYIFQFIEGGVSQGIFDMFNGGKDPVNGNEYGKLRIGEKRTVIIPGWLSSTSNFYDTEQEYIVNVTGTNYIYEFQVIDQTEDIVEWQIDTIEKVQTKKGWLVDSLPGNYGMYYMRDTLREIQRGVTVRDSLVMPEDTVIYINYIGRLLNGKVFDTNIKDSAKVWGLYDSSNSYEPVSITWNADSTALTMGDSSSEVIKGFSLTLFHMHPYESGRGMFTSEYGYGSSGSGYTIPSYAPLIFEIDVVDNPN